MRRSRGRSFVSALGVLCAFACQRVEKSGESAPQPAPSAARPKASAATKTPEAPPRGPYEGRWSGTYEATLERVVLEKGGVRAWKDDDGTQGSGTGTLTVEVHPDGRAHGEATGPLGAQRLRGIADEHGLRLTLSPKEPDVRGFSGTLVAAKAVDRVSGELRASSGDSLTVRKATVELRPSGS